MSTLLTTTLAKNYTGKNYVVKNYENDYTHNIYSKIYLHSKELLWKRTTVIRTMPDMPSLLRSTLIIIMLEETKLIRTGKSIVILHIIS